MATMYYLFFGFLFTAVCSFKGCRNSVLDVFKSSVVNGFFFLYQGRDFHFFLDEKTKQKNQGLVARLNCPLISGNKTNSLRSDKSDCVSEIIGNSLRLAQPRPFYSGSANSPLQPRLMLPVKYLAFKDDLLAYRVKGRKATNSSSVHFVLNQDSQSKGGIGGQGTLGTASAALRSRDEDRLNSLDLCGTFYQGKVPRRSGNDNKRNLIIAIASKELGTREATGRNDGPRVEEYLRYTNLGKGYEWCAAFVSWIYGQAGFDVPRNPWSPALFPKARVYWRSGEKVKTLESEKLKADVFGIYGSKVKRINHVGLVKECTNDYLITIEGNSNDRVESRRRHLRTVYALAGWVDQVNE